jgi:hypothetical protein
MGSEVAKRKCMGDDCENDAGSLQCPTCLKLDIKDSYFCSQDCFKRNWVSYTESRIVWSPKRGGVCALPDQALQHVTRLWLITYRVLTKRSINQTVTSSTISLPRKSYLNPIQKLGCSTPSQHSLIPAPCAPSTLFQNVEQYQNRYHTPITR